MVGAVLAHTFLITEDVFIYTCITFDAFTTKLLNECFKACL